MYTAATPIDIEPPTAAVKLTRTLPPPAAKPCGPSGRRRSTEGSRPAGQRRRCRPGRASAVGRSFSSPRVGCGKTAPLALCYHCLRGYRQRLCDICTSPLPSQPQPPHLPFAPQGSAGGRVPGPAGAVPGGGRDPAGSARAGRCGRGGRPRRPQRGHGGVQSGCGPTTFDTGPHRSCVRPASSERPVSASWTAQAAATSRCAAASRERRGWAAGASWSRAARAVGRARGRCGCVMRPP